MVPAVLYTQTHPAATCLERRRRASERVELHPFTRAAVRACFHSQFRRCVVGAREQYVIGEMTAVEALVGTAAWSTENAEREVR